MCALTRSEPGRGGLATLKDSGWVLSLSVFHQPEIIGWGFGLYPERNGDFVRKRMDQCSGAEILEETLRHLRFDRHLVAIMGSSICVPCNMPMSTISGSPGAAATGLPRFQRGRPISDSSASTSRCPGKIAFTIECSVPSAWEAIYVLLKRGPAPPRVYQSQYDPKALFNALKVFVCQ
jgi:oleate hydratase